PCGSGNQYRRCHGVKRRGGSSIVLGGPD
ncbi:hypothetical protein D0Z08_11320, partial [Nocardioides immobilis]